MPDQPRGRGRRAWDPRTIDSEVLAIHAALMPTSQILFFGGNEFNPAQRSDDPQAVDNTRLFDLRGWKGPIGFGGDHLAPGAWVSPVFEQAENVFVALTVDRHGRMNVTWLDMKPAARVGKIRSPETDTFCCGHASLADGRLLIVGRTKGWPPATGPHSHYDGFSGSEGLLEANQGNPKAGFDTIVGQGTGVLNGVSGATASFKFTDAGEPGRNDTATITISDRDGNVVFQLSNAKITAGGNHQAHRK